MLEYPSIISFKNAPKEQCIAFEKLDGSNCRAFWSKKNGFHRFGTRHQLIDRTHELGQSIDLFLNTYGDFLDKYFRESKYFKTLDKINVFYEFFGKLSFAGQHVKEDTKEVTMFDIYVEKKGFVSPSDFLKMFESNKIPRVVYRGNLNVSFINDVKNGIFDLNEGVVCKGVDRKGKVWMAKIKTNAYLEKLKKVYANGWEKFWE